jgi:hypothetical protein
MMSSSVGPVTDRNQQVNNRGLGVDSPSWGMMMEWKASGMECWSDGAAEGRGRVMANVPWRTFQRLNVSAPQHSNAQHSVFFFIVATGARRQRCCFVRRCAAQRWDDGTGVSFALSRCGGASAGQSPRWRRAFRRNPAHGHASPTHSNRPVRATEAITVSVSSGFTEQVNDFNLGPFRRQFLRRPEPRAPWRCSQSHVAPGAGVRAL